MRRAALAAAFLLGLTACGSKSTFTPPTQPTITSAVLSWTSDGNPLVLVCGTALVNCKSGYTVLDQTTGVTADLPITANAYSAPSLTDIYAMRVNGYDWQGLATSSPYEVAAKQPQ